MTNLIRSIGSWQFAKRLGILLILFIAVFAFTNGGTASAGTGGRFTMRVNDSDSIWGVDFYGAGLGEIPFVIDTQGDGKQELAVYYNNRITVRNDNGGYWGLNFYGAGKGEVPLAIDRDPSSMKQQFAMYYQGRFTWLNSNNTYDGVTFPGAGRLDIPLAYDVDGNGVQELAVYRSGRFTWLNSNGTTAGVTFAGATATDIPFAIDSDGNGIDELAVYRDGRMTVRRENGSYWGINFPGGGTDDYPIAVDTNNDNRQEFALYNHVPTQFSAKQILGQRWSGQIAIADYADPNGIASDRADRSLASMQLEDIADGGDARLSRRCTYASQLPSSVAPDPALLRFLVDYGQRGHYNMNVLFGQCHSGPGSAHHKGKAVDFACNGTDISAGDQAGPRYGVKRNYETCAANQHWHYSVDGI